MYFLLQWPVKHNAIKGLFLYNACRYVDAKSPRLILPFLLQVLQETYNSHLDIPVKSNNLSARLSHLNLTKAYIFAKPETAKHQTQHAHLPTLCTHRAQAVTKGHLSKPVFSSQVKALQGCDIQVQGTFILCHVFLTSVDRQSFGNSAVASACIVKSPESEKGVRGLIFNVSPLCNLWPQELIQTRASTASMSFCSRVLQVERSLSCRCRSRRDS